MNDIGHADKKERKPKNKLPCLYISNTGLRDSIVCMYRTDADAEFKGSYTNIPEVTEPYVQFMEKLTDALQRESDLPTSNKAIGL